MSTFKEADSETIENKKEHHQATPYTDLVRLDSTNGNALTNNASWSELNNHNNEDDTISIDVDVGDLDDDNISTPSDVDDAIAYWHESKNPHDNVNNNTHNNNSHDNTYDNQDNISNYLADKIMKYAKEPRDTFITNMFSMTRIPSVICTFKELLHLEIKDSGIVELTQLPPNVIKVSLAKNKIVMIAKGVIHSSVKYLDLSRNELVNMDFVEGTIEVLNVAHNNIPILTGDLTGLVKLDITNIGIISLDNIEVLPNLLSLSASKNNKLMNIDCLKEKTPNLNILETCSCGFESVKRLPLLLNKWISNNGKLSDITLEEFPEPLEDLDLFNNYLVKCPPIGYNLTTIDLMNNELKVLMDFHKDVDALDVRENPGMSITDSQQLMIDVINKEEEKILLGKEDSDSDEDHFEGFSSGQNVGGGHMRYEQWIQNLQSQQRANSNYDNNNHSNYNNNSNHHSNSNNHHAQFLIQQKKRQAGLGPRVVHKHQYTL